MTPEQIEAERALFEPWARQQPAWLVKDLQRDASGNYGHASSAAAWTIWLARAEQAQRVRDALEAMLAVHDTPSPYGCPHCSFHPTSSNDFCDAHRPGRKAEVIAAARAAIDTARLAGAKGGV